MHVPFASLARASQRGRAAALLGVALPCTLGASRVNAAPPAGEASTSAAPLPQAPPRRFKYALLVNPLGPIAGAIGTSVSDDVDAVYSFNLRFYQRVSPHVTMSAEPVFTAAQILDAQFYTLGLKWGPRMSWGGEGFGGWYATALVLAGGLWGSQAGNSLTSAGFLGTGVEGGYAWQRGGLLVELGIGFQYSGYFTHQSFDGNAIPGAGFKPLINASVGYAW